MTKNMVHTNSNKKTDIKLTGKQRKEKVQAPLTKIVVRKLPSTFSEEDFRNAISPIPDNNYFAFVPADKGLGSHGYSRAYINFVNAEEIFSFRDRFDGYVFVDQKGNEYPALVEYAPFQKVPKPTHQKKDIRCGTIDEDSDYVTFLDLLQNPGIVTLPPIETLLEEIENLEKETRANNGILKVKTPLLEYVEQRNAERYRPGDKKRRKEYDRKKAREEEKRKRKESLKEYRKRDDHYGREEREKERTKKREEERLKWKERKEERDRQIKKEKAERYKNEDRTKTKDSAEDGSEAKSWSSSKESVPPPPGRGAASHREERPRSQVQKTKRYSEVRKKEDKKQKEGKSRPGHEPEWKEEPTKEGGEEQEVKKEKEENKEEKEDASEVKEKEEVEEEQDDVGKKEGEEKNGVDGGISDEGEERMWEEEDLHLNEEVCKGHDEEGEDFEKEGKNKEEQMNDVKEENADKTEELEEDNREDKNSKDPRTERRIRNKDRPAMQLYRPGQSRLKTRVKWGEDGALERGNDDETSSSSTSPVMGASEEKPEPKGDKISINRGRREKKPSRFRESWNSHQWEVEKEGHNKPKEDVEGGKSTLKEGGRKGYSYFHERESKGKWSGRTRDQETTTSGSQVKSLTFRRSTSQE